jgi:beta-glucosidase
VLELSGKQMELFDALRAMNIPMTTVLVSSKPLCVGRAATQADAFICAFNGGMFGGEAVAKAIFGEINPCGRLPISFPRASGQVPVYYNSLPGWHHQAGKGYCDLPDTPLYTFGEGMGYSVFAYSDLTFDQETMKACVKVTNAGDMAGTETVQVYFNDVVSSVLTPVKQLIAFKQVELAAGESAVVEFALTREDFSLINRKEKRVTEPGEFVLMIGHSSKDDDLLKASFRL